MCGAPYALTRLSARTFLLISLLLGSHNQYKYKSVRTEARERVRAPSNVPNCHLDKTTMDNSSMHQSWGMHRPFSLLCTQQIFQLCSVRQKSLFNGVFFLSSDFRDNLPSVTFTLGENLRLKWNVFFYNFNMIYISYSLIWHSRPQFQIRLKYTIKGSVSQDLRWVLLYINRKLSLRPIIA